MRKFANSRYDKGLDISPRHVANVNVVGSNPITRFFEPLWSAAVKAFLPGGCAVWVLV